MSNKSKRGDLVAISGGGQQPAVPKVPNRWKAFDAFADDADGLVERYHELRQVQTEVWQHIVALKRGELIGKLANAEEAALNADDGERLTRCLDALALLDPAENYEDEDNEEGELKRSVISGRLASLIGAYPAGRPGDPEVYTRMLLEHVAAVQGLGLLALDAACREIVATKKFLPAISEVLEVITEQLALWSKRRWAIDDIAQRSHKIVADIEELRPKWEATSAARDEQQARNSLNFNLQQRSKAAADAINAQQKAYLAANAVERAVNWLAVCDTRVLAQQQALAEAVARLPQPKQEADDDA